VRELLVPDGVDRTTHPSTSRLCRYRSLAWMGRWSLSGA